MFYLLLIPVLCLMLLQYKYILDTKKHDFHLYRFCELRRECISLINDKRHELSRTDYVAVRKLLDTLNITINNYKDHKSTIFNFRRFVKHLKEFKSVESDAEKISTADEDIKALIQRMHYSVYDAFLAYTPFLRSEVLLEIMIRFFTLAAKTRINSLALYLTSLQDASRIVHTFKRKNC